MHWFSGLLAAISGSILHQYFRKNEPNPIALVTSYACFVILFSRISKSVHDETSTEDDLIQTLYLLAIHLITLSLSIIHYRTSSWHPLNKFSGPQILSISKFSSYPSAITGETHRNILNLHRKYQTLFLRIGPNELSISDISLLNIVLGSGSNGQPGWDKGPMYQVPCELRQGKPSLNEISASKDHSARRKLWEPAFSTKSVDEYFDLIIPRVEKLMDFVEMNMEKPLAMNVQFGYAVWDIMLDLAFSGTQHAELLKNQKDNLGVFSTMAKFLIFATTISNTPYISKFFSLIPLPSDAITFLKHCHKRCEERLANEKGTARKDVFSFLSSPLESLDLSTEERDRRFQELQGDCVSLAVAGADTTSSTLTFWIYDVLSSGLWKRLQDEIDSIVKLQGGNEEFNSVSLEHEATFLEATILETLRLNPVVPWGPLQRIAPDNGFVLSDGRFIPGGTKVIIAPYCVQRNAEYFHRPDEYIPERWLPGWTEKHVPEASIAFSYGQRGCIGKRLAMREIRLFATGLIRKFDAKLDESNKYTNDMGSKSYFTTQFSQNVMVRFERRSNH